MSATEVQSQPLNIASSFAGRSLFVTGATGFLGKVLVEKLLRSSPDLERLILLIRPGHDRTAEQRLHQEILTAPLMARLRALHGESWQAFAASKIAALDGDLDREHFGLDPAAYDGLCGQVDLVVACAATVTFDERLDRSLAINVHGARRALALARDAGNVPLLQVSTCFVSGRRTGSIAEQVVGPEILDEVTVLADLEAACTDLRTRGETADSVWVAAGDQLAERQGFNDIYTLTKALAERWVARERGSVPLAIVRPAIVESAAEPPLRGWIEAVRVSDPLLVAYGRGRTHELPGSPDVPLELIPVDFVVNAMIAALAALVEQPVASATEAEIPVYQVGSRRHPITLGELMDHAREGFRRTPLRDAEGQSIVPGELQFTEPEAYRQGLIAQRRKLRRLARWVPRRRDSSTRLALHSGERTLDHLIHLLAVYRPYLSHGAGYDDRQTLGLWQRLSATEQAEFPFDIAALDWPSYIAEAHVPGLVRFALKADSGAPVPDFDGETYRSADVLARAADNAAGAATVFELFAATAEAYPEVMAFQICRQGQWLRYTYRQALEATANIALRLAEQGIGRGDRVVLCSTGCPEWVLTTFAVHRLGATTVPLDPQWPAAEVVEAARLVDARLICAAPALVSSLLASSRAEDGTVCQVVALAAPFVPEPQVGLLPGAGAMRTAGKSEDLASIIFTSGTTVAPKAVPLTHANYLANVRDLVPLMELTRERLLSVLPIHHVFEQMVGLLVPLSGGSTFSYVAEVKPAEISWMMNTTQPTVLVAVPRLLELLHNGIRQNVAAGGPMLKLIFKVLFALSRRKNGENGHQLFAKVHRRFGGCLRRIASGGSALDPSLGRSFQLMGFKVAEGYGMTETSPVLTVNQWDRIRFGSVGQSLPGVEIDLRPPSDDLGEVEPGSGEVWVRGANVMSGYYESPEATAAVMDGDWLNTGDIGYFDDDGYLHLSGRSKDVIVTSAGKNIYPEEVEARYRELAGVAELVVLGLPDAGGGERVTALVVPAAGAEEDEIRSAIAGRSAEVPSYQQVAGIEFWRGDLPKTTTMKVKRAVLRAAVLDGQRGSGQAAAVPPSTAPAFSGQQTIVVEALARLTRCRADQIQASDRLADLGVDSLTRVELVGELEGRFGVRLDDDAAARLERVQDLFDLGGGGSAS